jgi:UDP-N-acetylglucosamine acyltransferase
VNAGIHPTAIVDPSAQLGAGVEVGPWVLIGPGVEIGDRSRLSARVTLECNVRLGRNVSVGIGAVLGGAPQDRTYRDEETSVEIGDDTVIREYVTVNRATAATGTTRVGEGCYLMSYVHLGHDCQVGDHVTIANATEASGHVNIQDHATLSGLIAIHQFVTIGAYAFVGGGTRVNQDVPPFVKAVGNPMELYGLNTVGLRRAGFSGETLLALKSAYRVVFNSDLPMSRAIGRLRETACPPEVDRFLAFLEMSTRGVPA